MKTSGESEVQRFITSKIDSVPHLEALLLLWNTRPQNWTAENVAARLYIAPNEANNLLQDLCSEGLIIAGPEQYCYQSTVGDLDELIEAVDRTYRREIVCVSKMIHSKAPTAVRDFARAFRFTKEK